MAAKTVIRPAAEADIPAILALYRQLDSALVAMQPEFFCEGPREEDEIRKAIRADDADFLLAERGGAVVGFALVGYAGWTPEFSCVLPHRYARLEDLAVDEAVRGQGVGSELLAAAKRWARNRRLEYLELNVLAQNENAIRLYESQDFVEATKVMQPDRYHQPRGHRGPPLCGQPAVCGAARGQRQAGGRRHRCGVPGHCGKNLQA